MNRVPPDGAPTEASPAPLLFKAVGHQVELRSLEVWQAAEFAAHLDRAREHIRPWVGPAFVTDTVQGARATLARYAASAAEDGARLYGLWVDDRLVGGVMFVAFNADAGSCELGCWLEPASEGRGLVTAATGVLLDWALHGRGLARAEWRCRADNSRSAEVARRLGMSLEGTLRRTWPYGGVHHDTQVWGLLASEWLGVSGDLARTQTQKPGGRAASRPDQHRGVTTPRAHPL